MSANAAIIVDVRHSRRIRDFVVQRDTRLGLVRARHRRLGLVRAPYTITVWDEFENLATQLRDVPQILFDLRRLFQPLSLSISVGIGAVDPFAPGSRLTDVAGGEAFLRARAGMDRLKARADARYPRLTAFMSGDPGHDRLLGHLYGMHDTLLAGITAAQWRTIDAVLDTGSQDAAAAALGVSASTVSRSLRRARYWQLAESMEVAATLM